MIYNQYRSSLGRIFHLLCVYKDIEIIEGYFIPDYVYMLMSIPSKIGVLNFMGYLKGKSALVMFCKHVNRKYKFEKRYFWAESYYMSTVEPNEATIKKDMQDQEKHNIAMDRLSLKEGKYLIRGSGK